MGFSNNSLSGNIPSDMCDSIPNIEALDLSGNQLSGEIPPNIWECRHLQQLALSVNHFNGKIPSEIGRLSMLRELYLGVNDFRGIMHMHLFLISYIYVISILYIIAIKNHFNLHIRLATLCTMLTWRDTCMNER